MTSISGTSSSSILKGMSGNKLTGLASGLDTDALVEAMTTTTRSRIAKMQQQKQLVSWKMDAFRSISSKLISFQNKYTSLTSSTSLRSSSFFGKSQITATGVNKDYVKVSGNGNNAEGLSIAAVKQLAKKASYATPAGQDAVLEASKKMAEASELITTSTIAGESITFSYGGKNISVSLGSEVYGNVGAVATALQNKLEGTDLEGVLAVGTADGKLQFSLTNDPNVNIASGGVEIKGMGSKMEEIFGFDPDDKENKLILAEKGKTLTGKEAVDNTKLSTSTAPAEALAGKTITFTYNGKSADITFPTENFGMDKVKGELQNQLNQAFGSGRVVVEEAAGKLSFTTKNPATGGDDYSSVLKVSGDTAALDILGLKNGASNRLNMTEAIGKRDDYTITITDHASGEVYNIREDVNGNAFNKNTTMQDIIKAINAKGAGVKVSYLETSDQLNVVSTYEGASGNFSIGGELGKAIFGEKAVNVKGQDAIISVDYGTGELVDISRGSNTFDLNGMKVSVSSVFDATKQVPTGEVDTEGNPIMKTVADESKAITFDAQVDTEKVTKAVKEMINEYNEIIKLANDMVKEKRNREYTPLSDEQKEDMTEEEIEKWEKKAKEGMLFNNSELRGFTNEIRFLFSGMGSDLKEMGITTSSNYADAGKIVFDEEAFKAALEEDPEKVSNAFVGYTEEDGTKVKGLMDNVKTVFDKYAATDKATKGIFVQMAGAPESPLSMLTNTLQKQLESFEDTIKTLQSKLEDEAERYYNKFSRLEVYINNMNAQSSWLAQQTGGY